MKYCIKCGKLEDYICKDCEEDEQNEQVVYFYKEQELIKQVQQTIK